MRQYQSIEDLFVAVEADKSDRSPGAVRYPSRLIFVNTFQSLRAIVSHLSPQHAQLVQLKSLLPHEDGWLSSEDMYQCVKSQKTDALIVPLSEVLRFFTDEELQVLLTSIFEIENAPACPSKRIYLPFVGLKSRCENTILKNFHRKDHWAPVWSFEEPFQEKIAIYQLVSYSGQDAATIPEGFRTLHHTSDWLDLWKHKSLRAIICKSRSMAHLYPNFLPDALFQTERIDSPKAYLANILGVNVPIEYSSAEYLLWDSLVQKESRHSHDLGFVDFDHVVNHHFNIQSIRKLSNENLVQLWFQHPEAFSRWLLKHWVLHQERLQGTYLHAIMPLLEGYSDEEFITQIWLTIFNKDTSFGDDAFQERKTYLRLIHEDYNIPYYTVEEKIRQALSCLDDKPIAVQSKYLTNISFAERTFLLELYRTYHDTEQEALLDMLKTIYPEFWHYVQWNATCHNETLLDWIPRYFREYNRSKALNAKTEELENILTQQNNDQDSFYGWYYQLDAIGKKEDGEVVWLDGVGAEWLPLLQYIINTYGKAKNRYVEKAFLVKTHLPTITKCNRISQARHITEFDEYIHNESPYTYPDDLIKQIELLKSLVKRHIIDSPEDRVVLVSDHGFTALSQKIFGNHKKYNFQQAEHEGRYMWTEQEHHSDSELLFHQIQQGEDEGKRVLVALRHASLYNTPSREVHGGATPEEVIVPYLVISKIDNRIVYHLHAPNTTISIKNPLVHFTIEPHPPILPVWQWKGKDIHVQQQENMWFANFRGFKAGEYDCDIHIHEQRFDVTITIQGGFKERDLL